MYNIKLEEENIPKKWYNILADLPFKLPESKQTSEGHQLENLPKIFSKYVLEQETSTKQWIDIPDEVRDKYAQIGRPSPLVRAKRLEEYLNTPAHIYYKREDTSPTGSHKLNSAIPQAYYAKKDGATKLTTETGAGQWGTALSLACSMMGLECDVYMVKVSFQQKPYRKTIMNLYNGNVMASPTNTTKIGRETLAKNPDHPGALGLAISEAVERALAEEKTYYSLGSVLNHVILHQTIIGLETQKQLEYIDQEADTVVSCIGGGSNAGGMMFPFMKDRLKGNTETKFVAVEPDSCPSLTKGEYKYDYGDTEGLTPLMKMYTLGHEFVPSAFHAGGLRYHGTSPILAALTHEGYIDPCSVSQNEIFEIGKLFSNLEGVVPAPETCHALKAAVNEAIKCKHEKESKNIVLNFTGHGLLDLAGYELYLDNKLE
ncbi:MAG: TrpB-like pyridoxal phosphate-dependent enzyme [Methanobacteriaceae archaeon]|nr:TrpB-like pyridoxal phosphate-dependent enzyme [Methanobacteriaceae archaeon]